jgi:hypothetical protein
LESSAGLASTVINSGSSNPVVHSKPHVLIVEEEPLVALEMASTLCEGGAASRLKQSLDCGPAMQGREQQRKKPSGPPGGSRGQLQAQDPALRTRSLPKPRGNTGRTEGSRARRRQDVPRRVGAPHFSWRGRAPPLHYAVRRDGPARFCSAALRCAPRSSAEARGPGSFRIFGLLKLACSSPV